MNAGAEDGLIPPKVLLNVRPMVTARPDRLGLHVDGGLGARQAAEYTVSEGDDGVELGARNRPEGQDERNETRTGGR